MSRRIEGLSCTADSLQQLVAAKKEEIRANAAKAEAAAQAAIDEMIGTLQERKSALIQQVREVAAAKLDALGEEPQGLDDGNFRLCTDEVVDFKAPTKELRESIDKFGYIDQTSTYASESYAAGPMLDGPLKANNPSWLVIYACDLKGQQRSEGGEEISVVFSGSDFEYNLEDLGDGRYRLMATPRAEGTYTLILSFAGEELRGAPFELRVFGPRDYVQIGESKLGAPGLPFITDEIGYLRRPLGLALDCTGRWLFVADQRNDRVQVFDTVARQAVCAYGQKGWGDEDFSTPGYVAVDRDSQVIVSDVLNHRLQILAFDARSSPPTLRHVRSFGSNGTGDGEFNFPRGLALNDEGHLFVCDACNHRIQIFDTRSGFAFMGQFGEPGIEAGQLDEPIDVAINRRGQVLVIDAQHRVQVFDPRGMFVCTFGEKSQRKEAGKLKHPISIAVDDEDAVFVSDQGNHRVQVFKAVDDSAKSYAFVHKWGGSKKKAAVGEEGGEEEAEADPAAPHDSPVAAKVGASLTSPAGIAVSAAGSIFVADYHGNVIFDY